MNKASAALLLEIGCEEIPARMIAAASTEFKKRVLAILDGAGLGYGKVEAWAGSRRLAVRIDAVVGKQEDRDEEMLGPPAKVAFAEDGSPTPAAIGFAGKQGIEPEALKRIETDRGSYVGYRRLSAGKTVGEVLAEELPQRVASMPFPKTMRWSEGTHRWVRPVHWIVALHGDRTLEFELFGIRSGNRSMGHRFRSEGSIEIASPAAYIETLAAAGVVVEPDERRRRLQDQMAAAAEKAGGVLVDDARLLEEVADLVEWPGVVLGRFEESYLELPKEILSTTLRHHQKCFSLSAPDGRAMPAFLAVANTDKDPEGHVKRGNEWVVGGRLDDARFFWKEDRKSPLETRSADLAGVVFHAKVGTFAEKTGRMESIARALGQAIGQASTEVEHAATAARLSKNDLLTGTVGEFPELQGQVGGLMLRAEEQPAEVAQAVYEHYRPAGAGDSLPQTPVGAVVSVADKLDTISSLIEAGEIPTGSRDPLGLRRACSGVFRIVGESGWDLSITGLCDLCAGGDAVADFLNDRLAHYFRETGSTSNEILAVSRPQIDADEWRGWPIADIAARLGAIAVVREREDFEQLADLTKRVDNILTKGEAAFGEAEAAAAGEAFAEDQAAAIRLREKLDADSPELDRLVAAVDYGGVIDLLAGYVEPVERFFNDVLVMDKERPAATLARRDLIQVLHDLLTRCFDLRELAGEADRSRV